MKVFVSVDIEGVAGVALPVQGRQGSSEYAHARKLMTDEASAAVRGAFDAGAVQVTVADAHGSMQNMLAEELDPRARLVTGAPRSAAMVGTIDDSFRAAVFVGFHARAGARGVMSHTYNGAAFAEVRIDDRPIGEVDLFGGCAEEVGVPLAAVTGDDRLADEVGRRFPNAATAVVKRSLGGWACDSLSPAESCRLIEDTVRIAITGNPAGHAASVPNAPLAVEVDLMRQYIADACALLPTVDRIGPRTIAFPASSYRSAADTIQALSYLAIGVQN